MSWPGQGRGGAAAARPTAASSVSDPVTAEDAGYRWPRSPRSRTVAAVPSALVTEKLSVAVCPRRSARRCPGPRCRAGTYGTFSRPARRFRRIYRLDNADPDTDALARGRRRPTASVASADGTAARLAPVDRGDRGQRRGWLRLRRRCDRGRGLIGIGDRVRVVEPVGSRRTASSSGRLTVVPATSALRRDGGGGAPGRGRSAFAPTRPPRPRSPPTGQVDAARWPRSPSIATAAGRGARSVRRGGRGSTNLRRGRFRRIPATGGDNRAGHRDAAETAGQTAADRFSVTRRRHGGRPADNRGGYRRRADRTATEDAAASWRRRRPDAGQDTFAARTGGGDRYGTFLAGRGRFRRIPGSTTRTRTPMRWRRGRRRPTASAVVTASADVCTAPPAVAVATR